MLCIRLRGRRAILIISRYEIDLTGHARILFPNVSAAQSLLDHAVRLDNTILNSCWSLAGTPAINWGSGKVSPVPRVAVLLHRRELHAGWRLSGPLILAADTRALGEAGAPAADNGVPVVMPDGRNIPDAHVAGGKLMSPVADLSPVAEAGRRVGSMYQALLSSPDGGGGALPYLVAELYANVGTGGRFDYQRQGSLLGGYKQLRQFRDASNYNVGLFCQGTGLTLDETLDIAGFYARHFSSNKRLDQPHGLDPRTAEFIEAGYQAAAGGAYSVSGGTPRR